MHKVKIRDINPLIKIALHFDSNTIQYYKLAPVLLLKVNLLELSAVGRIMQNLSSV